MDLSKFVYFNRLSECRTAAGLTQEELAHLVGVSKNTISNIEVSKSSPSVRLALLIAYFLCVPVDQVFTLRHLA